MRRKPVSRDEVRIFSDHRWNREMSITTAPIDAVRVDGYGGGDPNSAALGPAVARAWRADTGHVRNGARAVPTMRPEILARPPQPRPLLLRPLRRHRSGPTYADLSDAETLRGAADALAAFPGGGVIP